MFHREKSHVQVLCEMRVQVYFLVNFPFKSQLVSGNVHESPLSGISEENNWSGSGGSWGPVELVAVIAGPVFLFCLLLIVGVLVFQHHQRNYNHRQRLDVEDPSCDHLYLAKDKTLQDLIFDLSTSGSGSGRSKLYLKHLRLTCFGFLF